MQKAIEAIKKVAEQTDRVILFHSASGKDSIALLDLIHPHFKEVVCVFMYIVKDLEHINRYINYATSKYENVRFVQVPHYALFSYMKFGYMGCARNPKQKQYNMMALTDLVREKYGIEWAFFGFKQSDSMNRRLMLRGYQDEAINFEQKKCYPLSQYKNNDILQYIERNSLVKPESYGVGAQSSGTSINDLDYLLFLRENYPNDLEKTKKQFPGVERLLFEHDYQNQNQDHKK